MLLDLNNCAYSKESWSTENGEDANSDSDTTDEEWKAEERDGSPEREDKKKVFTPDKKRKVNKICAVVAWDQQTVTKSDEQPC